MLRDKGVILSYNTIINAEYERMLMLIAFIT